MRHFHLKHDHDRGWLHMLTLDASNAVAQTLRERMGYRTAEAFFEEAPASILAHEAWSVLEAECPAAIRTREERNGTPLWVNYELARDSYLLAALVFGRADLLAAVLLDCSNHVDAWPITFKDGVHRTLPSSARDLLIDQTPADVLNLMLVTDLPGDLYRLPVWVAILLASRPTPSRYGAVLRRLADAGATGFREHLEGKHPVLMNRVALDRAIEKAETHVAYRTARSAATCDDLTERLSALRDIRDALMDAERRAKEEDEGSRKTVSPVFGDLFDTVPNSLPQETDVTDVIMDPTERALDAEEVRLVEHERTAALIRSLIQAKFDALNTRTGDEAMDRKALGLPPIVQHGSFAARQSAEQKLLVAISSGRTADVSKALLSGADPDTPLIGAGSAMTLAIECRQVKIVRMLLAHGATATLRNKGFTMLSRVASRAKQQFEQDYDEREGLEDALDPYIEIQGLLVRAGATADQMNACFMPNGTVVQPHPFEPNAWHWLRHVPMLYEGYLDAVEERKAAVQEADQAMAAIRKAVEDYPEHERKAALDVNAMLAKAKGG
ncbi:ankyrin repeat domain-containing protein [Burkholderia vietnamiensis]|uniref:ankyrin repeat domain-containing protein n=1 Tax=Burkholderia vietnamiensis TaxID=60552 RepID=UPI001CF5ADF2|nr:ankyrin repeat domain-containing protein [Burkholderia vietnamiensis]MCA8448913.1 ankyrin repeat domain-containing protein [Burkholderia vietnamiensis]